MMSRAWEAVRWRLPVYVWRGGVCVGFPRLQVVVIDWRRRRVERVSYR